MKKSSTKFFRNFFVIINIFFIVLYLMVCLVPYIDTAENWYFAFPGPVFPLILFVLLLFIFLWALLRSRWFWISLVTMLLGIQQIVAVFSFHSSNEFSLAKQQNTLRVLQWNVMNWDENNNEEEGLPSFRLSMMDLVQTQKADILCFEEFFEPTDTSSFKSNISAITKMGYSYHFYVSSRNYENDTTSGLIIFSKFPIIDSAKFNFNKNGLGEHLIYVDIKVKNKIFRIFATHLRPINFADWDYERSKYRRSREEVDLSSYGAILSKFIKGYQFRYPQAELIKEKIAESPYPPIICGDFNDIPNSSTYFEIKGNMQDPFLKKGSWTGRTTRKTFGLISPTLRIDYILADKKFTVTQYQTIHVPYSDHYPVETDLEY